MERRPPATDRHLDEMARAQLPLVRSVVNQVSRKVPRHIERDDLMAAGLEGLAQALRAFDPERGLPFEPFARRRVRGAVLDELRRRDWAGRIVRARTRLVQHAAEDLTARLGRQPTFDEVAAAAHLARPEVVTVFEHQERAVRLERHLAFSSEEVQVADTAPDPEVQLLDNELRASVTNAVELLPERLRRVVVGHYHEGREMRELAVELGVTAWRVSQMCSEAVALLRAGISDQLGPAEPERDNVVSLSARRLARRRPGGRPRFDVVPPAPTAA